MRTDIVLVDQSLNRLSRLQCIVQTDGRTDGQLRTPPVVTVSVAEVKLRPCRPM